MEINPILGSDQRLHVVLRGMREAGGPERKVDQRRRLDQQDTARKIDHGNQSLREKESAGEEQQRDRTGQRPGLKIGQDRLHAKVGDRQPQEAGNGDRRLPSWRSKARRRDPQAKARFHSSHNHGSATTQM